MRKTCSLMLCTLLVLCACRGNHDDGGDRVAVEGEVALPSPEMSGGSVTGMPDRPGPGPIGAPAPATSAPPSDSTLPGNASAAGPATVELPGNLPTAPDNGTPPAEPTVQDAVAVLRDYYAAIATHDYARAHALWSDAGRASGQTLQQFADGFADTASIDARFASPGPVDAAAGSRYVEIPVTIDATRRDGSTHRYTGSYILRRAVVDGTSAEQRAWRIASARLRETR